MMQVYLLHTVCSQGLIKACQVTHQVVQSAVCNYALVPTYVTVVRDDRCV